MARTQTYLANLRGPSFEPLEVQPLPALVENGVTLDVYAISYPGLDQPASLYLDPSRYQDPLAPAGLKCPQPFDLPPP